MSEIRLKQQFRVESATLPPTLSIELVGGKERWFNFEWNGWRIRVDPTVGLQLDFKRKILSLRPDLSTQQFHRRVAREVFADPHKLTALQDLLTAWNLNECESWDKNRGKIWQRSAPKQSLLSSDSRFDWFDFQGSKQTPTFLDLCGTVNKTQNITIPYLCIDFPNEYWQFLREREFVSGNGLRLCTSSTVPSLDEDVAQLLSGCSNYHFAVGS